LLNKDSILNKGQIWLNLVK